MNGFIKRIVSEILTECESANSDDMLLLSLVVIRTENDLPQDQEQFLTSILSHWHDLHLPNLKTVERCRRDIQSKHPELKDLKASQIRKERERKYRNYYKRR